MLALGVFLNGLKLLGAATAALPEIKAILTAATTKIHPDDQNTAKDAYEDLITDNEAGNKRLDAKLAKAEKK